MDLRTVRDIDPDKVEAQLNITAEDLDAAFAADDQATHDLFYSLFGPHWEDKLISVRLDILSQVAARAERAAALNLSAKAEPK
jgi:hypothetical protein